MHPCGWRQPDRHKDFQKLESHADLAPYARYLRAEASYDAEEYATTAGSHRHFFPPRACAKSPCSKAKPTSRVETTSQAETPFDLSDTKIAEQAYIPDPMDANPAEARWLAEGARLRGAPRGWQIGIVSNLTDNPTSDFAEKAEKRLISMGERIPDSTTETGRNYIKRRAKSFRTLQHHKESIELLDLLPAQKSSPKTMAYSALPSKGLCKSSGPILKP